MMCSSHSGVCYVLCVWGRRVRGFRPPSSVFQPWENSRLMVVAVQGAPNWTVFVAAVAVAVFCCGRCRAGSYDFMSHVSWDHVSCHVINVLIFDYGFMCWWLGRDSLRPLPDSY